MELSLITQAAIRALSDEQLRLTYEQALKYREANEEGTAYFEHARALVKAIEEELDHRTEESGRGS
jgi:hypothetical protein